MRFCETCEGRLEIITDNDLIEWRCVSCNRNYESLPEDSLIFEEKFKYVSNNESIKKLESLSYDITTLRSKINCNDCGRPYMTTVRSQINEQIQYICQCMFSN